MTAKLSFPYKLGGQTHQISFKSNDFHITSEILRENTFYEHWLLEAMYAMNIRGGTFFDIGANTGNHTIFFSKFLADRVFAFEPLMDSLELLVDNVIDNDLNNCQIFNAALGNKETTVYLEIPDGASIGGTRVAGEAAMGIKQTTVDAMLSYVHEIRCMKIDVEGMELAVLDGALAAIIKYHPELFVESFGKPEVLKAKLEPHGYELKQRYCHAPVYHFSTDKKIPVTYK